MKANYDLDGSGAIDKNPEVDMIPCDTWKVLDDGVKSKWGYGIRIIYGFQADKIWVGDAIGFNETARVHADGAAAKCLGGAMAAPSGTPAERITAATPGQGGGGEWDSAVLPIMVSSFDKNGSGWIDTTDELLGVPCEVYVALDTRVKEKWQYGVRVIYGFESDKIWIGNAIGFGEVVRAGADLRIASCLAGAAPAPQTSTPPVASDGTVAGSIRAVPGPGGQTAWDASVAAILVRAYDQNKSGWIDTAQEARAITCADWAAMDAGVKESWDYGIRTIYGFLAGYSWVGDALKIKESQRELSDARLAQCLDGTAL